MKKYAGLIIFICGLLFDQITKIIATTFTKSYEIIPNFLNFTYIKNTGAAFGIGQGANSIFILITSIITIFILGLIIASYKKEGKCSIGLFLILTGAIGNLIDRIFRGFVIDFIDTPFIATFNIADSLICIGAFWLVIEELCISIFSKNKME